MGWGSDRRVLGVVKGAYTHMLLQTTFNRTCSVKEHQLLPKGDAASVPCAPAAFFPPAAHPWPHPPPCLITQATSS